MRQRRERAVLAARPRAVDQGQVLRHLLPRRPRHRHRRRRRRPQQVGHQVQAQREDHAGKHNFHARVAYTQMCKFMEKKLLESRGKQKSTSLRRRIRDPIVHNSQWFSTVVLHQAIVLMGMKFESYTHLIDFCNNVARRRLSDGKEDDWLT